MQNLSKIRTNNCFYRTKLSWHENKKAVQTKILKNINLRQILYNKRTNTTNPEGPQKKKSLIDSEEMLEEHVICTDKNEKAYLLLVFYAHVEAGLYLECIQPAEGGNDTS